MYLFEAGVDRDHFFNRDRDSREPGSQILFSTGTGTNRNRDETGTGTVTGTGMKPVPGWNRYRDETGTGIWLG